MVYLLCSRALTLSCVFPRDAPFVLDSKYIFSLQSSVKLLGEFADAGKLLSLC